MPVDTSAAGSGIGRDPFPGQPEKCRVADEAVHIIEPAGCHRQPPTGATWPASPVPVPVPDSAPATAHRYSPAPLLALQHPPCHRAAALVRVAGSPDLGVLRRLRPARHLQPTTSLPDRPCRPHERWANARRFPRSLSDRSPGQAPSFTPAASPRLRRRPSPWPPAGLNMTRPGVSRSRAPRPRAGTRCTPARIHQI